MPVNAVYQHYSDNVTPNASIVATTEDSAYPAENIANLNPAKPAKLTGTTGNWVFDFTSAQRVDLVAIIHHNLTAGLEVRIQGNATDSWSSPTFNQQITIPAYKEDGYPTNPWLDLRALSGYSASGFRFWRLVVVGTNGAAVAIGEFVMGSLFRSLDPNIDWGVKVREDRRVVEHTTDYGVSNIYELGVTVRGFQGSLDSPDTQADALDAWWRDTRGRVRPFLLVPDGTVNDAWFVRWASTQKEITRQFIDRNTIPVEFAEVGRGLTL